MTRHMKKLKPGSQREYEYDGSIFFAEEKAKPRGEEASGVERSFVAQCTLDVLHALGEGLLILLKRVIILLKLMDSVLLPQGSNT